MGGVYEEDQAEQKQQNKLSTQARARDSPFNIFFARQCAEIETGLRDDQSDPGLAKGWLGWPIRPRRLGRSQTEGQRQESLGAKAQSPVGRLSTRRVGVIDGRSLAVGNWGVKYATWLGRLGKAASLFGWGEGCVVPARMERGSRRPGKGGLTLWASGLKKSGRRGDRWGDPKWAPIFFSRNCAGIPSLSGESPGTRFCCRRRPIGPAVHVTTADWRRGMQEQRRAIHRTLAPSGAHMRTHLRRSCDRGCLGSGWGW